MESPGLYHDFVVIDFETTGLSPEVDEIIEFGAVRVRNGEIQDRFSELADPGRPIPPGITGLTGIRDRDVRGKPPAKQVYQAFRRFIGDEAVLLAHQAAFEAAFLEKKESGNWESRFLDTLILARMVWPELAHHDLESLAQATGHSVGKSHRALDDAQMTAWVWLDLLKAIDALHPAVVRTVAGLLKPSATPYARLLESYDRTMAKEVFQRKGGTYRSLFRDFSEHLAAARAKPRSIPEVPKPLDVERMAHLFSESGLLSQRLPNFEFRSQQVEMVRSICQAFNDGNHALIEAGTGTGKSLAYLAPAIGWSLLNRVPVVLSTNTKSLQAQLFDKDIPALREALRKPFQAVCLKGAGNYLCTRKFLQMVERPAQDLTPEERLGLATLTIWAARTETGDVGECSGFINLGGREIWERYGLGGNECLSALCRDGARCFVHKARGDAAQADVIVVNHALVLSELGLDNPILPPYSHLVIDEAHNLENVATETLARRVARYRLHSLLNRLHPADAATTRRGLLASLLPDRGNAAGGEATDAEPVSPEQVDAAVHGVLQLRQRQDRFFRALAGLYRPRAGEDDGGRAEGSDQDRLRYAEQTMDGPAWNEVRTEGKHFIETLRGFHDKLSRLMEGASADTEKESEDRRSHQDELRRRTDELAEYIDDLECLLQARDENTVYWVSREGTAEGTTYALQAAPIDVGPLLVENLFTTKQSIVMVSATLTVAGGFGFFKARVGLDRLTGREVSQTILGSCFDLENQVLLAVPSFLPAPEYKQTDFHEHLGDLLVDVFGISRGRGLVLCTSYAMLGALHAGLKRGLAAQSILVLGQGVDGEPAQLARIFKSDNASVLLGTHSFWEGFDAPGRILCCVVVAKLPFPVFTDPLVEARCDLVKSRGENPFNQYMVPTAAIRLKQGFGRLIRTKSDFGVVVLTDKRVLTKNYGAQLLGSLPVAYHEFSRREEFLRSLQQFLEAKDAGNP